MVRRNVESRNKMSLTHKGENKPDVSGSLPALSCDEFLGQENLKIILREDFCCDLSHSSHSLFPLVYKKKDMFRPWMRNKPMVFQVPLFNYLPIRGNNLCTMHNLSSFSSSSLLSAFSWRKKSNKSTGRICGCLIWAFFVSSNNPENWWFLVLAELYGIYYPCPFLQENNGVGKEEKGTLFFQAFFPNKKEKATAKGLCVLLGTESFSLAISKILRRTQKFDFWKSLH